MLDNILLAITNQSRESIYFE